MDIEQIVGTMALASTAVSFGYLYLRQLKKNNELEGHAMTDSLTGLPNRRFFYQAAPISLSEAKRHDEEAALLYIDFRKFKEVNDAYGHKFGDEVLAAFADAIRKSARSEDIIARVGGDEFVAYLKRTDGEGSSSMEQRLAQNFMNEISALYQVHNIPFNEKTSPGLDIGVARAREFNFNLDAMILSAETRMYEMKRA